MIKIFGAQGNVHDVDRLLELILDFSIKNHIITQVFDGNMIYGKNHLVSSYRHALRSIKRKTNTTNSLGMEILLYASGKRQLKLAIPKMGIKKGKGKIVFIIIDENGNKNDVNMNSLINDMLRMLSLVRNDCIIDGDKEVLIRFGISENEIKTVTKANYGKLILEKIALVDIIK